MASGLSILYANKVADKLLRGTDFTPPTSYWVALFTHASAATYLRNNDIASALEPSGNGYSRIEVRGATSVTWPVASAGWTEQSGDIVWNPATDSWGNIKTVALMDAVSGGNVVMFGDLAVAKDVTSPEVFRIPSGFFDFQL